MGNLQIGIPILDNGEIVGLVNMYAFVSMKYI